MRASRAVSRALGAATCVLLGALAGCSPQRVPLELRFPSTETFLVTQSLRVRVFPVSATVACASLMNTVMSGGTLDDGAVLDRADLDPCEVRAGLSLPDVGGGLHAFVVEGIDRSGNSTILAGCSEDEVYAGTSIAVALSPTDAYQTAYEESPPDDTETVVTRCGGGV